MKRKRIQFAISLLITVFFLYLAFRNVPLKRLAGDLRHIRYIWAVPFMIITIISMYFRTLRWHYLLEPVVRAPTHKLFSPVMICFALNSILPGRAGEFARAYLVSRDYKVPFSSTLATVIVERIADGLGLLALFIVILAFVPLGRGLSVEWNAVKQFHGGDIILWGSVTLGALAFACAAGALLLKKALGAGRPTSGWKAALAKLPNPRGLAVVLVVAAVVFAAVAAALAGGLLASPDRTYSFGRKYIIDADLLQSLSRRLLVACMVLLLGSVLMLWGPFRRTVQAVIRAVPFVPHGLKEGLNRFIETFVQGFHSLRSPRIVFWIVIYTAVVWLTVGWSLMIMAKGFPGLQMSFAQGMATAIIICVAILIPAAPGYWGLYEVGCILALQMLGVVPINRTGHAMALSFSLVVHFLQILPTIGLGFWFMWRRQMALSELTRRPPLETPDS